MYQPYPNGTKVRMKKEPQFGEYGIILDSKRFMSGLFKGIWVYKIERDTGVCSIVDADDFEPVEEE